MSARAPNTKAKDLLNELVTRYARMSSYSDTGVVRRRLKAAEPPLETAFSTFFKKPSLFRFEFSSPHPFLQLRHIVTKHVVGSDGKGAYSLTQEHEEKAIAEMEESLGMAVAGATGISGGSAHTIGRLLLPEVGGLSLLDLVGLDLKQEVEFDSTVCFCIAAKHPKVQGDRELWIERDTLLLRKVVKTDKVVPAEEIRENIRVDALLDNAIFAAPKQ